MVQAEIPRIREECGCLLGEWSGCRGIVDVRDHFIFNCVDIER